MDRISRRQVVRGAAAAAAMTLGAPSAHAQKDRQTLRFVAQADLKILDPVWTTCVYRKPHPVCRRSNSVILVMKAAENGL
jgi:peptide/nickel transport system substrate-binding protein